MPVPTHFRELWRALDEILGGVRPTWWGAVVTDSRFPRVWDANYARIDSATTGLRVAEIEAELVPALAEAGSDVMHVVSFHPEETAELLAELSTRGHRLGWDLLMELDHTRLPHAGVDVGVYTEPLEPGEELWSRLEASLELFGVDASVTPELLRLEQQVFGPAGKRWFGVRDERGTVISMASLILLQDVGYVDHVVTFPSSRRRGFASALTSRLSREALGAGAAHVSLLADPDRSSTIAMYERLGFRQAGTFASTKGPVPQIAGGGS
jgi:GNAT superfamily N-acetyltransferase